MAELNSHTTIGGSLVFSQASLPLFPMGNVLQYKDFIIYSEYSKPTSKELGVVNIAGDTMTGDLTINKLNAKLAIHSGSIKTNYTSAGIDTDSGMLTINNKTIGMVLGSNSLTVNANSYFFGVFDNNKRVYSDNNKPTNNDLDLVSRKGDTLAGIYNLTGSLRLATDSKIHLDNVVLYKSGSTLNIGSNTSGAAGLVTDFVLHGSKTGEIYYNDGIRYKIHHDKNQLDIGTTDVSARSALKLGNAATHNYGTTVGSIAQGNDSRIVNAVQNTRRIIAGTGLNGTSDLKTDVTLSVKYGTVAGTAAQGNDSRIVNAASVSYTDSELAKKADKTITITAGKGLLGGGNLSANRTLNIDVGTNAGQIMEVGAFGLGGMGSVYDFETNDSGSGFYTEGNYSSVIIRRSQQTGFEISSNYSFDEVYFRRFRVNDGGWQKRLKLYHEDNILDIGTTPLSARNALALGNSAQLNVGTAPGTVAAGNDIRIVNAVPNSRVITASTGLDGGGSLASNITLSVKYGTTAGSAAQGNDSRIVNAVQNTRRIIAGTGLNGTSDLKTDVTLSVKYGTAAGTAAQGNDSRIVNAASTSYVNTELDKKVDKSEASLFAWPIGSCYTQYPSTPKPEDLFGGLWKIILADGSFFRTEGGNASAFESGQQQDLIGKHTHSASTNTTGAHTHTVSGTVASGGAHTHSVSGSAGYGGDHTHPITGAAVADKYGWAVRPAKGGVEGSGISTSSSGAHTHSVSGTASSAGAHGHAFTNGSAASAGGHAHTVTVNDAGGVETRPINRTIRIWQRIA